MKPLLIAALTAFVLATPALAQSEQHPTDRLVAHAGATERYEGGTALHHAATPQRAQALAQAESPSTGETMYRRRYASEQTGVDNGRSA